MIREFRKRNTVSLTNFYGRRAKRLLPAAGTVLVFISVGSLILFSTVMQMETGGDVIAAALYFVNWHFIVQGVDYFAFSEGLVSPVQHFWSLSVEEQFYIFWPAFLLLVGSVALRVGKNPLRSMLVVGSALATASFVYSLIYSPINPESAYLSTLTRGWQILAGAILALAMPRSLRMPALLSELLVLGGAGVVMWSFFAFNQIDPYPGWRGLIPVFATVAFIIGGSATYRSVGVRFLATRPFQYLGKISYSWYLWQWPFVVFATAIWGQVGPMTLVLVSLAAWIPAEIAHRTIEEPFRRSRPLGKRPRRALALGGVFSVMAVVAGLAVSGDRIQLSEAPEFTVAGAEARDAPARTQRSAKAIRPVPAKARKDKGGAFAAGCLITGPRTESGTCHFGTGDAPSKRVALIGDSHALQYSPTLNRLAREQGWRVTVLARGSCLIADVRFEEHCDRWRESAFRRIESERPDLTVISSSTLAGYRLTVAGRALSRNESQPYLIAGMARTLDRLKAVSGRVALIRDQARAPFLPHECVAANPSRLENCVFRSKRRPEWAFDLEAARLAGVKVIDPEPKLCHRKRCPSVIGDALVYRDTYHLSATFARTLADWLARQLPGVKP